MHYRAGSTSTDSGLVLLFISGVFGTARGHKYVETTEWDVFPRLSRARPALFVVRDSYLLPTSGILRYTPRNEATKHEQRQRIS